MQVNAYKTTVKKDKAVTLTTAGMRADPFMPGLLFRLSEVPQTVAIVCASRIGDFLCATPAFRALKTRLPSAKFTLIGLPFVREMASRNPHLDDFEPFPGFPGMAEQFFDAGRAMEFFNKMQRRKFDLAVQMHGSGVYSNIFTLMLGARHSAGFVRARDSSGCLDAALPWPASLHAGRRALALAVFLGAAECGYALDFPLSPGDRAAASALINGCPGPLIGLHPGSREPHKMWPGERFAQAGAVLRQTLGGGTVLVVGGPEEKYLGGKIAESIGPIARNLAGQESLLVMAALISRLSVLITNDSGPAHIAYALATPSVTLFGETDPREWGPPRVRHHRALRMPDRRVSSVPVDEVVRAAYNVARL